MKRIISKLAIAILAVGSTSLMAQTITVGSNSGLPGATVIVPVNFAAGNVAIGSFDVEVSFDNTNFSAASADCGVAAIGQNGKTCSGSLAGGKFKGSFSGDGVNAFTSGLAFNLSFTIAGGATPGDKALDALAATLTCGTPTGDDIGPPCTISLTDGKVTVNAGPQPAFSSSPVAPGGNINLASTPEGGTAPTANINITNTGAAATTLTGTCAMGAGDAQITLTSDGAFSVAQGAAADVQTVSCSTAARGNYSRTLSCPHNAAGTPATYTVNCTITAPVYTSNPVAGSPLTFDTTEQGATDPTKTISVTNTGPTGTQLDVNCTDSGPNAAVFSVSNGVITDLLPSGGARVVTVTCDSVAQGSYTGTLSCDHNGSNAPDPATYALSCEIGPLGAAIYASVPGPGSTIDLTPDPVAQGTNVPTKPLVIENDAALGKSDLFLQCGLTGDSEITQAPLTTGQFTLNPQETATANFDCDTSKVGTYTATYSCGYDSVAPTKAFSDYANYTVNCKVREPAALVAPTPASGTPQQAIVAPGGSHTFSFVFNETNDEGVDGGVVSCDLDDGTNYEIISPASFPVTVPAGGSVTVQVKGTDPGGVESFADTLNCVYSDTENPYETKGESDGQQVSWPLNLVVGGDASFLVIKEFTDGDNPTEVEVTISCNTGLPIIQSQTISETQEVTFIVQSFDTGELDCTITEDLSDPALAGYTPSYYAGQGDPDSESCEYTDVNGGDENKCIIVNDADPVPVEITKDWIIEGMGGDQVNQNFELTLYCDAEIVGGYTEKGPGPAQVECGPAHPKAAGKSGYEYKSCLELDGNGDTTFTPHVIPEWPSSNCWVDETVYDDSVEIDNDCGDISVSHGQGDSCLITNTVFFEGIPTLSQYGMAIMALLMLGVGLVGFRRFV